MAQEEFDLSSLEDIITETKREGGSLIPTLQKAQDTYGYLPKEVLQHIAEGLSLPLNRVYGVTTFYSQFHLEPRGRHLVQQCDGTACHVRGAKRIMRVVEEELGIKAGETTEDLRVTYEVVYCLGSCGLSPVATVDGRVIGRLTPDKMIEVIRELD